MNILDKALLRPGRLNYHLTLYPPSREDIKQIIEYHLLNLPLSPDFSIDKIVTLYCNQHQSEDNYNVSEITSICNEVRQLALNDHIQLFEIQKNHDTNNEFQNQISSPIRIEHFESLLKSSSTSLSSLSSSSSLSQKHTNSSFPSSSFQFDVSKSQPYSF